ncbi:MAG: GMP synthase [Rhizobiaceae bacterium]|nr:GMP synthase [Rhizobiaceae bacterium]
MRVLVVQNYDKTGLGQVGRALREAGAEIDQRMAHLGEKLPADASSHDGVVVLGGGQSALDDEDYPYIPHLLELLRDFERRDRSVLGICLGSQLLARAFGGRNLLGAAPEFGWQNVSLTGAAAGDPVFAGLPASFPIFQWHDDTFTLPPSAVLLAGNGTAANQAFRVGRAVYGCQFHFEADRSLVADWQTDFAETIAERHPQWPARYEWEAAAHGPAADAAGLTLARAWVQTVGA